MSKTTLEILPALILGAGLLLSTAQAETLNATVEITFSGSSTLHDFAGEVVSQPFVASFREDKQSGLLYVSASAGINVQDMTTDNKKRDKNMFKMFDLEHFKIIAGELGETAVSMEESTQVHLHLKICNTEQDVVATIGDVQRTGDQINCRMQFPVSLETFNLKGPSVLGLIRVDDTVYVECAIKGQIGETATGN